jgi:hypothetical protein
MPEMLNYKESVVNGTVWQRCHTVTARNPFGGQPKVEFAEEKIIMLDGEPINQWAQGCAVNFAPDGTFPLLDPLTNLPTGQSMTHAQVFQVLYSLYMQTATARDAAEAGT